MGRRSFSISMSSVYFVEKDVEDAVSIVFSSSSKAKNKEEVLDDVRLAF